MTYIRPGNPRVHFHLAHARSLWGRKKEAIASLLESNADPEPLRKMTDYRKLIDDLKRRQLVWINKKQLLISRILRISICETTIETGYEISYMPSGAEPGNCIACSHVCR